ncbi:MAG: Fic family protein [Proteobacteria bacterium]|nr:Fic family protein [Pseudomonadota bacterium]MBU1708438.1 Fic family protein [Pseudomonadota bacterium]
MKKKNKQYSPPYEITPTILDLVERIGESLGRISLSRHTPSPTRLRRENRIQSIQASLNIEGNTLNLEQVTAVMDGKRVLGSPREIQEVRNAIAAYEQMEILDPGNREELCRMHALLMQGLIDDPGMLRKGSVGIKRGDDVVHIAPPAERVPFLLYDLLKWLENTREHPLISGSVFHYEFEFIHPFTDGNGRLGRLWQTLILGRWKPIFFMIPIESVIRDRQADYYGALQKADKTGSSTPFIEYLLNAILAACDQITGEATGEATGEVQGWTNTAGAGGPRAVEVMKLLKALKKPMNRAQLQARLKLKSQANFRERYLQPALAAGFIEMTIPDKPRSSKQKYRLTEKGRRLLQ